jgi:nucleotide sugar dehydrogenase
MGMPLAVQFASHGWSVIAVDIDPAVVAAINEGRLHIENEPRVGDLLTASRAEGRLTATTDGAAATAMSDVVVIIVPVSLDTTAGPDRRAMDSAVAAIAQGIRAGTTVIFETTLPVGDTRGRYAPMLATAAGIDPDDLFVAFSPERLFSGAAIRNLATYPKLVGGVNEKSVQRAAAFYDSVLDADVLTMSSAEAAEFAKLADTTYRDVNIALANEYAHVADRFGLDIIEVIDAANSQPYSHIHQPGIGVGGHCIPVYPHFLLEGAPELQLVALARRVNDGQVDVAMGMLTDSLASLEGATILVLGLTYREGVKELANSSAVRLLERLVTRGARPLAYDPLLGPREIARLGAEPWTWSRPEPDVVAIVTQTADRSWNSMDPAWFPGLKVLIDGRNSLRGLPLPDGVSYRGFGVRR